MLRAGKAGGGLPKRYKKIKITQGLKNGGVDMTK